MNEELRSFAYRSSGPIAGATYSGFTLNELAAIATILLVAVQLFFVIWDRIKKARKEREQ